MQLCRTTLINEYDDDDDDDDAFDTSASAEVQV